MTLAQAVIGANFGDEGKGLVTDWLARPGSLVVRHNGGAQAGHTVVTPEGLRHIFGHFGAGTMRGAETLLSRFFICNPLLFHKEYRALLLLGVKPRVAVDPNALVTTPYDMIVNQAVERARGAAKHGSCGVGVWETVVRSRRAEYKIVMADLQDPKRLVTILTSIRDNWVPERLAALGYPDAIKHGFEHLFQKDDIWHRWIDSAAHMRSKVSILNDLDVIRDFKHVIFEGAQGLLLDEVMGEMPWVTASRTGVRNALFLAVKAGIERLDTYYVTRSYLTRHGAGPLVGELEGPPWPGVVDTTNTTHEFQGSLRYAHLDIHDLATRIAVDAFDFRRWVQEINLVITCLDQCGPDHAVSTVSDLASAVRPTRIFGSRGPTRADVTHHYSALTNHA